MTIKTLKEFFHSNLHTQYPKTEIDSFFFILIAYKLNLKRIDVALEPNFKILENEILFFNEAIEKLQQEIPIQYIIEETEFFGLPFKVDKNVLIPRPETEELVRWIIDEFKNKNQPQTILDIGTGSGCIAISLAKNLPNSKVIAIDVSENALKIAKENAELNNVKIEYIEQDILASTLLGQQFDVIVSNPPYVRELEKQEIKKNVLDNEPHVALFVQDNNPLLFYEKIATLAKNALNDSGQLFFEINQYLGNETLELLKGNGFENIELRKDIFNNDRMIKATLFKINAIKVKKKYLCGMRIDIITVSPELIKSPFEHSIIKRTIDKGLVEVHFHDLRKYALNKYGKIDDYQFGGGAGMVLMIEPIDKCISELQNERTYDEIIYMTPDAPILNQATANKLSLKENIIILTGHYKGVDQRVRDKFITQEISIGDYVLSGGELAAAVVCDAIIRLIPGAIGDETSALTDSFQDNLLSPPVYTRPSEYKEMKVPEVLLSGNFPKIDEWRSQKALEHTKNIRPDLLED